MHHQPHPLRPAPRLACWTALILSLLLGSVAFAADEVKRTFDLPGDDATVSLKAFMEQSGHEIMYPVSAVRGLKTNAVKGEFTSTEALNRMLHDTGLVAAQTRNNGTYSVRKETEAEAKNAPRAVAQRSARPNASEPKEDKPLELPTFEVMSSKLLNMDIKRSRDDAQPYVVFEREQISLSGAGSIGDFLKEQLTMNTQAGSTVQGFGAGEIGTSYINLRGLGASQTLILVDGRQSPIRFTATGGISQPDLNGIPLAAVERIEVLPSTASGIYGGSAVGGVVNVVLRRDYAGAELKVAYGNAFDSDVATRRADFAAGFTLEGGKTNVLLALGYSDGNSLVMQDRDYMRRNRLQIVENNQGNPDALLSGTLPPQGSTANIRSSTGVNLTLKDGTPLNSSRTFVPAGYRGIFFDGGAALVANAGRYNLNLSPGSAARMGGFGVYSTPMIRAGSLTVQRQIVSHLEAYVDLSYSSNTGRTPFGTGEFTGTLPSSAVNNPFQQSISVRVPMPATAPTYLYNRSVSQKIAAGLVVELPAQWKGNVDYAHGRSYGEYSAPTFLPSALTAAVTAGTVDVLRDTSAYPLTSGSFGGDFYQRSITPPVLTSDLLTIRVAGSAMAAPGGPVTLSAMVGFRAERTRNGSWAQSETVPFVLVPGRSRHIHSAYLETKAPLIGNPNKWPLIRTLDLQLAARYDDYLIKGSANINNPSAATPVSRAQNKLRSTDPTAALLWSPIESLVIRASYGTGFLPPSMNQLISRPGLGSAFTDPRRGSTSAQLPAGQQLIGGNPNLRPEQSESWSAGVVWTPQAIPDFRLSIDYTRIDKEDGIATLSPQDVVNNETFLPARVTRGPNLPSDPVGWAGPVTFLDVTSANIATAKVEAFDLQVDYSVKTVKNGRIDLRGSATWQTHLKQQTTPFSPLIEFVGHGAAFAAQDGSAPLKFKASAGVTWVRGPLSVSWNARYYDSYWVYAAGSTAGVIATQVRNQGNEGRVERQIYQDLSAAYRFTARVGKSENRIGHLLSGLELAGGVRNVLNKEPPFDANNQFSGYYSFYGDPRGAMYFLSVKRAF